jgi:hypothetical protein
MSSSPNHYINVVSAVERVYFTLLALKSRNEFQPRLFWAKIEYRLSKSCLLSGIRLNEAGIGPESPTCEKAEESFRRYLTNPA